MVYRDNYKLLKLLIFWVLVLIMSILSTKLVLSEKYISVGLDGEKISCIFNNTKILIDTNKDGVEEYVLDCDENTVPIIDISPRIWSYDYIIKTTKPIIYYRQRYSKVYALDRYWSMFDTTEYLSEFEKEYRNDELNIYEKGKYIFYDSGNITIQCLNSTTYNLNYNRNVLEFPCDFYFDGILNAMPYDKGDLSSGYLYHIPRQMQLYLIGIANLSLDFNSTGIIDDYFFINNSILTIPENTIIKADNKIMIRKTPDSGYYSDRNYLHSFGSYNSTYFSSCNINNAIQYNNQNLYQLNREILNPDCITKKMNLDLTIFRKFKSYTKKSIEIIITNPTFNKIDYEFYYSISQYTKTIVESVRDLNTDEMVISHNNYLDPFTYKKIVINLENSFDLLELDYYISFDEVYYN